jgi:NADPH:quinone reductase
MFCRPFPPSIVLCGSISLYQGSEGYGIKNLPLLVGRMVRMQGFMANQYRAAFPAAIEKLRGWVSSGAVTARETVTEGLENLPEAFIGLFEGKNTGKAVVQV